MGKLYYLNKIKIKSEADALEFIEMVAEKLPEIKAIIRKSSLERQSLINRVDSLAQSTQDNGYLQNDVQTSVLQRATGQKPASSVASTRIDQLRAVQQPVEQVDPGEIGQLIIDQDDEGGLDFGDDIASDSLAQGGEGGTLPTGADLTPIGSRVAGKADSLKVVERRKAANDLRK